MAGDLLLRAWRPVLAATCTRCKTRPMPAPAARVPCLDQRGQYVFTQLCIITEHLLAWKMVKHSSKVAMGMCVFKPY